MDTAYRFIIIDSDEVNSFISCKAIMLAARETTIHTFIDPVKGMEYLKNKNNRPEKGKTILFINADLPGMTTWNFIEEFQLLETGMKNKTGIYILSNMPNRNDIDYVSRFSFVKGFIEKPLSRQTVTDCVLTMH
jgi:hypothetical protein